MTTFEIICNSLLALGGLGTVGTLINMICESKRNRKRVSDLQKVQDRQLELLYRPDIRITSWIDRKGLGSEIIIENYGEDIVIESVEDITGSDFLNKRGMINWFPRHLDKHSLIHLPFIKLDSSVNCAVNILSSTKLDLRFITKLIVKSGKPSIVETITEKGNRVQK